MSTRSRVCRTGRQRDEDTNYEYHAIGRSPNSVLDQSKDTKKEKGAAPEAQPTEQEDKERIRMEQIEALEYLFWAWPIARPALEEVILTSYKRLWVAPIY
jgi:hypothetical protein